MWHGESDINRKKAKNKRTNIHISTIDNMFPMYITKSTLIIILMMVTSSWKFHNFQPDTRFLLLFLVSFVFVCLSSVASVSFSLYLLQCNSVDCFVFASMTVDPQQRIFRYKYISIVFFSESTFNDTFVVGNEQAHKQMAKKKRRQSERG